jgi:Protein of unknown function (DUF3618)
VPQDPAQIQRQIEDTRAELAHTIDAIADIVSPKRAARRGVEQLRGKVEELKSQLNGTPQLNGSGQQALPPGMSSQLEGSTLYGTKRTVRWDRIALVGGGAFVLLLIIRRRRNGD